jgi:hypothetical protein
MSKCPDWVHCHGTGGSRGGGGRGALVLVAALALAAVIRAAWHAITGAAEAVVMVAEITACVVIAALGAAVLGALGYGALAARRRVLAARRPAPAEQLAPGARWAVRAEVLEGDRHTLSPGQTRINPGGRPDGVEIPAIQGKRPVSATGAHLRAVPDPDSREGAKW